MARIHLFEIEDQNWFPGFLRNYMTDFLQFLSNKTKMYRPIIPIIQGVLKTCKQNTIIDLCSGGGGGLLWLNQELSKSNSELKIILTDLYPNIEAYQYTQRQASNFDFIKTPVNALAVSDELKGVRSIFLGLHHFKPKEASAILEDAVNKMAPIMIFEAQERSLPSILAMLFSPITVLLTTPFIRPFSFGRILFTYLIPIVPLCVGWDGIVSSLRTYSVKEMKGLVENLPNKDKFTWEIDRIKSGPSVILYLTGIPKPN